MIKVSVIVPAYNAKKYVKQCLESILSQTLKEIEIVFVDNNSTDKTLDVVEKIQYQDARIRIIKNTDNIGPGPARNLGIKEAKGEFVAFCDADDWYPNRDSLEKMYNAAKKHKVNIVCGSFSEYDSVNKKIITDWSTQPHLVDYKITQDKVIQYKDWQSDIGWIRCIYNREFLLSNNITFPSLSRHEDPVFFVDAMVKAEKFYAIKDIVYRYRIFHKPMKLTNQNIQDAITGIAYNLATAKEHQLDILFNWCVETLLWYSTLSPEFRQMQKDLNKAHRQIEDKQRIITELEQGIDDIKNSQSYKVGLKVTAPYRKIKAITKQ